MSRARFAALAVLAAATLAACAAPTAPAPASTDAPSYDMDAGSDTTNRSGYQVGQG